MEIKLALKGIREHRIISGDRVDVLEIEIEGIAYTQIRVFKKGFSKSEYVKTDLIQFIKKIK